MALKENRKLQRSRPLEKDGYILVDTELLGEKSTSPTDHLYTILSEKEEKASIRRSALVIAGLCIVNLALLGQCLGLFGTATLQRWNGNIAAPHAHFGSTQGETASRPANESGIAMKKRTMTTALTESSVSCDLCPAGDDFCMELGYHNIARSVAYEGSNNRVHAFLRKLKQGKAVSVAVVGGSVSSGHGLAKQVGSTNEKEGPYNMHRQVFDWLTSNYPNPNHKFTNGAVPATGSLYFSACFAEHIPEDVDIIFIELAINDVRHVMAQVEYEQLMRALLDLPNRPAIINMHVFGLVFDPISQGGDQHLGLAHYYDTPVISSRSLILPMIYEDYHVAEEYFSLNKVQGSEIPWEERLDGRHFGVRGHRVMSSLVQIYFQRQLCKMAALDTLEVQGFQPTYASPKWPSESIINQVPKMLLTQRYDKSNSVPKLKPQCLSTISEKHPLVPSESFGWTFWNWKEKRYLVGRLPGAKMSIPFESTLGEVKVYYQRSAKYGLGQADCWVDDDVKGKVRLDGYWTHEYSIVESTTIRRRIAPGKHLLHCEIAQDTSDPLSGGHEFRITSLTAL